MTIRSKLNSRKTSRRKLKKVSKVNSRKPSRRKLKKVSKVNSRKPSRRKLKKVSKVNSRKPSRRKLKKNDGSGKQNKMIGIDSESKFDMDMDMDSDIIQEETPDEIIKKGKGRYGRTDKIIGKGSYKIVYKGFDLLNMSEIAWSSIDLKKLKVKEEKERVINEIKLLKEKIDNEFVLKIKECWYDKHRSKIVMITELFDEGTLFEYILKHRHIITIEHIRRWTSQILRGLYYLHSHGIIHRDLKLDNIFFDKKDSKIIIGDFGLATLDVISNESIGTPEYMALEIFEKNTYDNSVDMYAFGMCLLSMLTYEIPYSECDGNPLLVYKKVSKGILPESLANVKDSQLKDLVIALLSRNPEKRPTAYELLTKF
jgi:WNK lysine deficient protein kinase